MSRKAEKDFSKYYGRTEVKTNECQECGTHTPNEKICSSCKEEIKLQERIERGRKVLEWREENEALAVMSDSQGED